ncbi:olfactory receptor 4D1-like [Trichosurus vulpecula]|uniref:olfactory receptor 4D1-like n=1 Tax=Trichosurus vulpecula TaxID=9337 RepID=UPI00186B2CD6|nr:olfactory receptor 4D1-like [Trichosurus vulpecula]
MIEGKLFSEVSKGHGNSSTIVTGFIFRGLVQSLELRALLFAAFFVVYITAILGNLLVVLTIWISPRLHTPMYSLLGHLSFVDICYSLIATPRMLRDLLAQSKQISFSGCFTQLFFIHFLGGTEILHLVVMAFDRYVAICRPLHYAALMNPATRNHFLLASWLGGLVHSSLQLALLLPLPFCGPNQLDNFYCDIMQVLELACTDTYAVELLLVGNSGLVTLIVFLALLTSYSVILVTLRAHSAHARAKALSTCGAHITVVVMAFIPALCVYAWPFRDQSQDKAISVLHIVLLPMLNPLVYTLSNKEMHEAMKGGCVRAVLWLRK